jgi:hypothetical protein
MSNFSQDSVLIFLVFFQTTMANRRILHWVFKIGNRRESMDFYKNILGEDQCQYCDSDVFLVNCKQCLDFF